LFEKNWHSKRGEELRRPPLRQPEKNSMAFEKMRTVVIS
jgi:hypothetical protein